MADDQAQFEALLQNLMSTDNDIRTRTEEQYDNIAIQNKLPVLLQAAQNSNAAMEVRSLAAVLLRRVFTSQTDETWQTIPEPIQTTIKEQLLLMVQHEQQPMLRKKICDVIAELARNMLDNEEGANRWPEVLRFLFDCANSTDAGHKENALHIISNVPGVFGSQQAHYIDVIKQMLHQCLADQTHLNVRAEGVRASVAFLVANEDSAQVLNHFRDFMPLILRNISENIESGDEDTLLKCLVELSETIPKFMRQNLRETIELCMKVLQNPALDDSIRHMSLETIVTLSETAPAMVRKHEQFIPQLFVEVLTMMVDLEDEPDWSNGDEIDEEDTDSNAITGESALDRIACGLGGKTILTHLVSNIQPMLANPDWRYRHAALMAISACGEGCHKHMEQMLGNIIGAVVPFLQDPHPRVRYASCNALGQMSTDFGPGLQKKFHEKVVPGLLMVMDDYENPRVQAHAGAALVNFSEDCPKNIISMYLDPIICKLEQVLSRKFKELLEKGTKLVLEQVVTTLASVADTAEEKFIAYYDRFMPCLKYIVQHATNPEVKLLRGKTIECISLIGLAVGREKFMADCSDVMQLLLKTQTDDSELTEDDPQMSYMISAWARMCKIMGKDFEQYLPLVMGPVLKAAAIKPEVALLDSDDMKAMENDSDWQFVTLGDQQKFGIRTAGLDEKATACQMLVCYARELKEGFAEYTEQVVKLMVPLLKFYFHDVVRIAAAEALPYLIECAKIKGDQYLAEMWSYICPHLIKAVESEPENDILGEIMHSLAKCVESMGPGCLSDQHLSELFAVLEKLFKDHFQKQAERQEQRKDEDYDEVVEENLLNEDDEDVYILSKISDVMHALFGTHKETLLPRLGNLLQYFVQLVEPERPWPDRQWGLCIWDDVIEFAGPHSLAYQEYFVPHILEYICDKQPEVRQAASYGIGIMAQNGGPQYVPILAKSLPQLIKVIEDIEARTVENINPTENAISAVTKICKHHGEGVGLEELLPRWLSWLPVWEDTEEAEHIYGYFCDLIQQNNPLVLGQNNQNLPRLLGIIAEAFMKEAITAEDELAKRMVMIVRQVQSDQQLFQACVSQLNETQQQTLMVLLSQPQ